MKIEPRKASPSLVFRAASLLCLFAVCLVTPARSESASGSVLCRPELSAARRAELAGQLRAITGWRNLHFDEQGVLRTGDAPAGGSQTARELLSAAIDGRELLVLEDASNRTDVVFCRVVEGRWARDEATKPRVSIVLIDFADFSHVMGDRDALAAFNVGWGVLHEVSHAVHDSADADGEGEGGDCEQLINRMRRECDLAERAEYHFKYFPGAERSEFKTRLVRLAFEHQTAASNKKRRVWLMWDANIVGGLDAINVKHPSRPRR